MRIGSAVLFSGMSSVHAILVGAVLIGLSILGARVIAPYQIAMGNAPNGAIAIYRLNTFTGVVDVCGYKIQGMQLSANPQCP